MTYRGFLAQFHVSLRKKRIFLFSGGAESTRADLVHILVRRFKNQRESLGLKEVKWRTCHLSEISDSLLSLLSESVYNVVMVRWGKGLVGQKELKQFLRGMKSVPSWFVILDDTGEVGKTFDEVFDGASFSVHVDCKRLPEVLKDKQTLIKKRLELIGVTADEEVVDYLAERGSFSTVPLLNTFRIIECVGGGKPWVDFNMKEMRKYGLLVPDVEKAIMQVLLNRGRISFLSLPPIAYNDRRLLWYIRQELILLLKCKTVRGATDQKRSMTVGLPYPVYIDYKIRAERMELNLLYRRLYSVLSLTRYRDYPGVVNLLVAVW